MAYRNTLPAITDAHRDTVLAQAQSADVTHYRAASLQGKFMMRAWEAPQDQAKAHCDLSARAEKVKQSAHARSHALWMKAVYSPKPRGRPLTIAS